MFVVAIVKSLNSKGCIVHNGNSVFREVKVSYWYWYSKGCIVQNENSVIIQNVVFAYLVGINIAIYITSNVWALPCWSMAMTLARKLFANT